VPRRYVLVGMLLLGSLGVACAQGEFLKRGEWGVGAGIGYSGMGEIHTTTYMLGVSCAGIIDIGASISKPASGGTGTVIPSITFYPSKQDDRPKALTIGITASYTTMNVSSQYSSSSPNGNGGWQNYSFTSSEKKSVIGIGITAAKRLSEDSTAFTQIEFGPTVTIGAGQSSVALALGFAIGSGSSDVPFFVITPLAGYEFKSKLFVWGIEGSFIL
jgi:hypothetical protein